MLDITTQGDRVIVKVRVQPKASRDAIAGEHDGALKIAVTAPPEKGKANKAAVEVLAKALGIAKSAVKLVGGTTSRSKTLAVRGVPPDVVEALLRNGSQ